MFLADTSVGSLTLPVVNSTSPYDGETNTSLNGSIFVYFSKDMDKATVEDGFELSPYFDGTFYWPDNKTLEYRPDDWIENETWFNVTISGESIDYLGLTLDGNNNSYPEGSPVDDFSFGFKSDFPPQINATYPSNGSTNVRPLVQSSINVRFSRAMNRASVQGGYTITPSLNVSSYTWSLGDTLFSINLGSMSPLGNYLNWSTTYTVTVSGDVVSSGVPVQSLDGDCDGIPEGSPDDDFSFIFTTNTPPKVSNYSTPSSVPSSAWVNFSSDMLILLTEPVVTVDNSTDDRDVVFVDDTLTGKEMKVSANLSGHSVGYWKGNTSYIVRVNGTAIGANFEKLDGDGDGTSEGSPIDDFSFGFTTPPTPKLDSFFPHNGSIDVKINQDIYFNFSTAMDHSSVEGAFNISPSVSGSFVWVGNSFVFNVYQYVYSTDYNVSLNGALDIYGVPLDVDGDEYIDLENFSFTFKTRGDSEPPLISGYGVLEDGGITDMDHTTIRVYYWDYAGIDNSSIELYINGVDHTGNATITNSSLYMYLSGLSNGDYDISVLIVDMNGNEVWQNWTFTVKVLTREQINMEIATAAMAILVVGVAIAGGVMIGRRMGWLRGGRLE